jgi:hypothetical protein
VVALTSQFLSRETVVTPAADERVKNVMTNGYSLIEQADFEDIISPDELSDLTACWEDLPLDEELADGGSYRHRRYGRLSVRSGDTGITASPLPHAPFQQSADDIPIYGGRQRVFAPMSQETLMRPALLSLVGFDTYVAAELTGISDWAVNVHLIRIIAEPNAPGLPTPEGKHRDGHAFVGMHMMRRQCHGGDSIVYRDGRPPMRLTLMRPLDSLIVDDKAVTHEVTPISSNGEGNGVRDMLLVDLNPA